MANLATINNNLLADSGIDPLSVVLGSGTANQIAYWVDADNIGALTTATYPSLTELSYVKGVTSAIQTQIDAKLSLSGGTMTGQIVLKESSSATDYTKGLKFPDNAFGGGGDSAGLRLYANTGENIVLELYVGNDGGDDSINFRTGVGGTPNNDAVTINGNKIWNAGNLPSPQSAITLTTTGTSGAATLVGATLNIPNYGNALSGYLPLSGGTMTGAITLVNGAIGIVVGDDATIADRNVANTMFVAGVQNTDRGYINFSQNEGNVLGAVNGGALTWRGVNVMTASNISGTVDYIPKFTAANTIGNSALYTDASNNFYISVDATLNASPSFYIQSTNAGSGVGNPRLIFARSGEETLRIEGVANVEGRIKAVAANVGVLTFYTGTNTEKMRLSADGYLGVGVNPTNPLTVSASNGNQIRLQTSSEGSSYYALISSNYDYAESFTIRVKGGGNQQDIIQWGDSSGLKINARVGNTLTLQNGGGNVAIGNITATQLLDVNGNGKFRGQNLYLGSTAAGDSIFTIYSQNGSYSEIRSNAGASGSYNGIMIASNYNAANSLPSWSIDLGGALNSTVNTNAYTLGYRPNGGSWKSLMIVNSTGAVGILGASGGSPLEVFTNDVAPYGSIIVNSVGDNVNQAGLRLLAGYAPTSTSRATRIDFLNIPASATVPRWTLINDYNQNGTNDFKFVVADQVSSALTLLQTGTIKLPFYTSNGFLKTSSSDGTLVVDTGTYPTGSGTSGYVPKWTGSTTLGNSLLYDNGTNVAIGTTSSLTGKFTVQGAQAEVHVKNDNTNTLTLGGWDSSRHYIKSINLGVALTPLTLQASSFTFDTGSVGIGVSPTSQFQISSQGFSQITNFLGGQTALLLRSQTTNERTWFGIAPNGTSVLTDLVLFSTSDVVTNYENLQMGYWGGGGTDFWAINTTKGGTGTQRALLLNATTTYYPNGNQLFLNTNGRIGIATRAPQATLHVNASGNVSGGTITMGVANDSTDKWSYLVSTQYNSSVYPTGFSVIGGFASQSENRVVIGGSIYECNPSTSIEFWTHTTYTHNLGGTKRMVVGPNGRVTIAAGAVESSVALFRVGSDVTNGTFGVRAQAVFGNQDYLDSDATAVFGTGVSETQFLNGSVSRPAMISLGGSLSTAEALGVINFFRSGNTDGYRSRATIYSGVTSSGASNQHGGTLVFATANDGDTNPTTRLTISQTGSSTFSSFVNVNYQTVSANSSINIESIDPAIRFRVSGGTANKRIYDLRAIAAGGVNDYFQLRLWNDAQSSATELLSVTSAGNLTATGFINSSSNDYRFSNNKALSLETFNSNSMVKINAAGYWGTYIVGANDQGVFINNSGNVGIRKTDPTYAMDVSGSIRGSDRLYWNGSNQLVYVLNYQNLSYDAQVVTDTTANQGTAIKKPSAGFGSSTFFYGNYTSFAPGNYVAYFRLKVASNSSASSLGTLDVVGGTIENFSIQIKPNMFALSNSWQYIRLPFTITGSGYIEWRMVGFNTGITDLFLDHVLVYQEGGYENLFVRYGYNIHVSQTIKAFSVLPNGTVVVSPNTVNTSDADLGDRSLLIGSRPGSANICSLGFDGGGSYRGGFDFNKTNGNLEWWNYDGNWRQRLTVTGGGAVQVNSGKLEMGGPYNIEFGYSGQGVYLSRSGLGPRASLTTRGNSNWVDIADSADWVGATICGSGGEVLVGTTTPTGSGAYRLQVNGSTYSSTGFFEASDIRLKTIINRHQSADFGAIEYNWNDGRDSKLHWGYAAQEVMKFLPDAVNGSEELFYTLDYNQVHTYKIAMLEKRIAELEQQLKNK